MERSLAKKKKNDHHFTETLYKVVVSNLNICFYHHNSEYSVPSMGSFAMEGDIGGAVARDDATVCVKLKLLLLLPEHTWMNKRTSRHLIFLC